MKSSRYSSHFLILVCTVLFTIHSHAEPGDTLEVTGEVVNLRAEPTTKAKVLIKLVKGNKVTEIQQKGNWIEVETHHDDIKSGWVHKSLLGQSGSTANTEPVTRFDRFMARYNEQNNKTYFSDVKNRGEGVIELTVTDAWLNAEREVRSQSVTDIFKLWAEAYGTGRSVSVIVLDAQGEQHMIMLR